MNYFGKGKYREAAIEFQNVVKIDPKYADAHYQLAHCYMKLGMWAATYSELNRTVSLTPRNWKAQNRVGECAVCHPAFWAGGRKGKPRSGGRFAERGCAHTLLAESMAALEQFSGLAGPEMQKATGLDPNRSNSYINLAILQLNAKQTAAAEESFQKGDCTGPQVAGSPMALGASMQRNTAPSGGRGAVPARHRAGPQEPHPRGGTWHVPTWRLERKMTRWRVLRQAKQALPDNSDGYRMLGEYYMQSGQTDKAIEGICFPLP